MVVIVVVIVVVVVVVVEMKLKLESVTFWGDPPVGSHYYHSVYHHHHHNNNNRIQGTGYLSLQSTQSVHYGIILNWPEQHQLVALPTISGSGEKPLLCSMESTE